MDPPAKDPAPKDIAEAGVGLTEEEKKRFIEDIEKGMATGGCSTMEFDLLKQFFKRAPNGYALFVRGYWKLIPRKGEDFGTFSQKCAAAWGALTEEEKKCYSIESTKLANANREAMVALKKGADFRDFLYSPNLKYKKD